MTDHPGVRLERDGPVATVTLCRPHVLNAQTPAMWEELHRFGRELTADIRVVVLRGEGRAFSAGLDLSAMAAGGGSDFPAAAGGGSDFPAAAGGGFTVVELARRDDADAVIASFQQGFAWLRRPDLISVAAVQGHAIGAGFQLALACDFRVLTEDAVFTMAEVTLGLVPDLGGTRRLVELVGYARALELCVTGRRVAASEADRLGLATSVVPVSGLDVAVAELVALVLAAPRDAVVEVKALLSTALLRDFPEQEAAERAAQLRRIRDLVGLDD
jgi:enoyl-CoA hydratase/carnithine racemase